MQKVHLYPKQRFPRIREDNPKEILQGRQFPAGTIFVLRYVRDGKRCFESIKDCPDLRSAFERRAEREISLLRGEVPAPRKEPLTIYAAS